MRVAILAAFFALGAGHLAEAQIISTPPLAYTDAQAQAAVASLIPVPRAAVPAPETVGGSAGTAGTYLPGNAQLPRISRATTTTTTTGGVFSGTWATALASTPNIVLTPIYSGSGNVTCFLTAAPTTTSFAGKCTVDQSSLLSLSIVTTGLTIGPQNAASGMTIQVFAIPSTQ